MELGWWESHEAGGVRVTCVPAQHWSMRVPWDRNTRLWGGFVYESARGVAYHAGDTAMSEDGLPRHRRALPAHRLGDAADRRLRPDLVHVAQHMGPEEAGHAWELLGARVLVAMHWGTFKLTDEPVGEPPERIRAWFRQHALSGASPGGSADESADERLWVLDFGETRSLR